MRWKSDGRKEVRYNSTTGAEELTEVIEVEKKRSRTQSQRRKKDKSMNAPREEDSNQYP